MQQSSDGDGGDPMSQDGQMTNNYIFDLNLVIHNHLL